MEILLTIDKILALPVVRWFLLAATVVSIATATWCKLQIGTVRLQRDAAEGRAATCNAALDAQNAAVAKAGAEAAEKRKQLAEAAKQAEWIKKEADAWRKKALGTPLTGNCDQMVEQVIEAVKR
jgi:hypothetical protein